MGEPFLIITRLPTYPLTHLLVKKRERLKSIGGSRLARALAQDFTPALPMNPVSFSWPDNLPGLG